MNPSVREALEGRQRKWEKLNPQNAKRTNCGSFCWQFSWLCSELPSSWQFYGALTVLAHTTHTHTLDSYANMSPTRWTHSCGKCVVWRARRTEGRNWPKRNETKRNQNELKQNEECAWLSEKSANGGRQAQSGREGEEERKLRTLCAKNLKMQINVSWPFSFLFLPLFLLLASSFFSLYCCVVTSRIRHVKYVPSIPLTCPPLALSLLCLPPCLSLLPSDSYSKVFWSLAFKVSHLYGIFMRSYECD